MLTSTNKIPLFFSESSANNGCGSEACLTVEALDALGFLITGASDSRSVIKYIDCTLSFALHLSCWAALFR